MMYFSNAKVDINTVDLDEYKRLKSFKTNTYPQGLVESYSSLTEFRDKLSSQLAIKVRDLVANDQKGETRDTEDKKIQIDVAIIPSSPPSLTGSDRTRKTASRDGAQFLKAIDKVNIECVSCVDEAGIPDFGTTKEYRKNDESSTAIITFNADKDYFRELTKFYVDSKKYIPCRIALINNDVIGVPSVSLQMTVKDSQGNVTLAETLPEKPSKWLSSVRTVPHYFDYDSVAQISAHQDYWEIVMDVGVVQAKRTIISKNEFFIGAAVSSQVDLETTVYSAASPHLC